MLSSRRRAARRFALALAQERLDHLPCLGAELDLHDQLPRKPLNQGARLRPDFELKRDCRQRPTSALSVRSSRALPPHGRDSRSG
jgi:hypothetical protein